MRDKIDAAIKKYVRGTVLEAVVINITVTAGILPKLLGELVGANSPKVYTSARVLKHLYDKRPAEEFDFIVGNLALLIASPDNLYRNKGDKRGQFCITKRIEGYGYFVPLEVVDGVHGKEIRLVTAFRIRSEPYLNEYDLLWSRRDGATHSS